MWQRSTFLSACALSCAMFLLVAGTHAENKQSPRPAGVLEDWERQYEQLASDIERYGDKGMPLHSKILDRNALILASDRSPSQVVLRRTAALLEHMKSLPGAADLNDVEERLEELKKASPSKELYIEACKLRRELAFSNPLLDFDEMIFVTKSGRESAMFAWDYGHRMNPGGGLFRVSGLKSGQIEIHDVLADSVVEQGRLKGGKLSAQGAFNVPALDYDGKTVVFSFVERTGISENWPRDVFYAFTPETCFHLYKVNVDGSGLVQISAGRRNDYHPCFLPNGRIVFVSDRRNVMARCQGGQPFKEISTPCGTMHSVKPDGSDLICIS